MARQSRFMHRRCASYGEAVLHKNAFSDEAASYSFRYEAFSAIAPNMKHSLRSYNLKNEK